MKITPFFIIVCDRKIIEHNHINVTFNMSKMYINYTNIGDKGGR